MVSYGCGCDKKKHEKHEKPEKKKKHKKCHKNPIKFCLVLTGSQEVDPVTTTGLGAGTTVLSKDRKKLFFRLYFKDLTSPVKEPSTGVGFAHFHLGEAGENGPIVKDISNDFVLSADKKSGEAMGVWTADDDMPFTKELMEDLKDSKIYVNVHTEANPTGEVRGQVVRKFLKKKKVY
jgi:hypothetical protein